METGQRGIVYVYLRQGFVNTWALYAEKGHKISPDFRGTKHSAFMQARAWASSWPSWKVVIEEENERN